MPQLRLVLVWLIMLAIPLQGLAAASMAICAGEQQARTVPAAVSGDAHDHSSHAHAAAPSAGHAPQQADVHAAAPDTGHECGACATCCHSPALTQDRPWPAFSAAVQAVVTAPYVAIPTAPSRLPDKPPRA